MGTNGNFVDGNLRTWEFEGFHWNLWEFMGTCGNLRELMGTPWELRGNFVGT